MFSSGSWHIDIHNWRHPDVKRPDLLVGTYALGWFVLNVFRSSLPVLLPELRRLYEFGYTDAGVLFGLLFAGIALTQFPSGALADIVGDGWVVLASLVASSVCLSLFAVARTLPALLVLAFSFGVAVGGFRSVSISAVSKAVSDDRRSRALGIVAAGNPLGNLLGPILAAAAILTVGVAGTPFAFGVGGLVLSSPVGVILLRNGDTRELSSGLMGAREAVSRRIGRVLTVIASTQGLLVVMASAAFSATWQGVFAFLPTYLVEVRQLDLGGAGVVTGVIFGVGFVASVGGGRIADRFGNAPTLLGGFLVCGSAVAILPFAEGLIVAIAALVGLGLGLGSITPARDAFISTLAEQVERGGIVGGVRTTYIMLASVGPTAAGLAIEFGGFDFAFFLLAILLGGGALTSFGLLASGSTGPVPE